MSLRQKEEETLYFSFGESSKGRCGPQANQPCSLADQLSKQEVSIQTFGAAGGWLLAGVSLCGDPLPAFYPQLGAPLNSRMVSLLEDTGLKPPLLTAPPLVWARSPSRGGVCVPWPSKVLLVFSHSLPPPACVTAAARAILYSNASRSHHPLLKPFPKLPVLSGRTEVPGLPPHSTAWPVPPAPARFLQTSHL